jgi:hypothetical protein
MHLEDPLQALDLGLGLLQVAPERFLKLGIGYLGDHFRQRLGDPLFGVVDVLEGMDEQIVQILDRL